MRIAPSVVFAVAVAVPLTACTAGVGADATPSDDDDAVSLSAEALRGKVFLVKNDGTGKCLELVKGDTKSRPCDPKNRAQHLVAGTALPSTGPISLWPGGVRLRFNDTDRCVAISNDPGAAWIQKEACDCDAGVCGALRGVYKVRGYFASGYKPRGGSFLPEGDPPPAQAAPELGTRSCAKLDSYDGLAVRGGAIVQAAGRPVYHWTTGSLTGTCDPLRLIAAYQHEDGVMGTELGGFEMVGEKGFLIRTNLWTLGAEYPYPRQARLCLTGPADAAPTVRPCDKKNPRQQWSLVDAE